MVPFFKAQFICSAFSTDQFPDLVTPAGAIMKEIAFAGRSNVGKSSLINHLLGNKNLAKVSSRPGKTKTLNFFTCDDKIGLVDLPGYGYAKISKEIKKNWQASIQTYLLERKTLSLLSLLLDIRHAPSKEDLLFFEYVAVFLKIPVLIIFTKADKVNPKEREENMQKHLTLLRNYSNHSFPFMHFSIKEGTSKSYLIKKINDALFTEVAHGTH